MHHWKINGNSVFFFKYTIKDGVHCFEDTRGILIVQIDRNLSAEYYQQTYMKRAGIAPALFFD